MSGETAVMDVLPEPVQMMVKVSEIGWAQRSGRTGSVENLRIDDLARSMVGVGQIDPVVVITLKRADGKIQYEGVDGFRRCLAAASLDIDRLLALVYPSDCAGRADEIRAISIVQSVPHSDVEKALMVGRLVEAELKAVGGNEAVAIENVAGRINKPERFVNDYRYLTRLSKASRALLEAGRLTLAQARELATVSDDEIQDEIAQQAASNEGGGFGRDLGWVTRRCRDVRRNLKVIPWDPTKAFAGKPACTTCPSNTANDGCLYAHDYKEAKHQAELAEERAGLGLCVNPGCFEHKLKAAEQAKQTIAKKAAEEAKKVAKAGHFDDAGQTARTVVQREVDRGGLAAGLKESIAIKTAKDAVQEAAPKTNGKAGETPAPPDAGKAKKLDTVRTVEQKAQERFDAAHEQWDAGLMDELIKQVLMFPGGYSALAALVQSGRLDAILLPYYGDDAEWKMAVVCQSPSTLEKLEPFRVVLEATRKPGDHVPSAKALHQMELEAAEATKRIQPDWYGDLRSVCRAGMLLLLGMAGGTYPEEPKVETFLAEAGLGETGKEPSKGKKKAVVE